MEEDQSQEQDEPEVCLKCGSPINHVPYSFQGKVFHARCLLCNACGKRLVGKPFITKSRQIFCGEQCKSQYEKGECDSKQQPEPPLSDVSGNNSVLSSSLDESLLEVLESITSSDTSVPQPAMERVTDYPVGRTTSYPRAHPPTPTHSETDSNSTYSEGSFNSDGSLYIHDANRKPKKKILKDSDTARRRKHKHRVRWNLENADTISVDSFHSMIVGEGKNHKLGHKTAVERQIPLGGSMNGLSQMRSPSPPTYHKPPSWSSRNSPQRNTESFQRGIFRTNSESRLLDGPKPRYLQFPSPQKPVIQSTPIRHHRQLPLTATSLLQLPKYEDDSSILNVPVFIPDENNIPPLDLSSADDKKKSKLFEFPQQQSRRQALSQDDADDYDHLPDKQQQQATKPHEAMGLDWYSKRDIDEALQQLDEKELNSTKISNSQTLSPPPLPPKDVSVSSKPLPPPPPSSFVPEKGKQLRPPTSAFQKASDQPPPVPERKSSLPSSVSDTKQQQQNTMPSSPEFSEDDNLRSQSCETLIDDDLLTSKTVSPSHTQEEDSLTPVDTEVHPEPRLMSLTTSWETSALKDRIVEGAEDPDRPPSTTPPNTTSSLSALPQGTNGLGHLESKASTTSVLHEFRNRNFSQSSSTTNSYHQPAPYQFKRSQQSRAPLSRSSDALTGLLPEEQYLFQRYSSGQGPMMMKPIRIDPSIKIEEMLAELDSAAAAASSQARRQPQHQQVIGVCSVCHKSIPSPKLLITFSGKSYHTTCFNCSSCGCSMTGQPIYERNGSILCIRDFQRLSGPQTVSHPHQIHSQSQKQWRQQQHYRPYNQQLAAQAPQAKGHYHYHHRQCHMQRSAGPGTAV